MAEASEDTTATNRDFWNSEAATYDSRTAPLITALTSLLTPYLATLPVPSSNGKALDFACGTGLLSSLLAAYNPTLTLRGIDISASMVEKYKERFRGSGVDADAVEVDLMSASAFGPASPIKGPEWMGFDLVAVANALHHLENEAVVVGRLAERVKEGGVLWIVDWVDDGKGAGGGHTHEHGHGYGHGHDRHGGRGAEKPVEGAEDQEALLKSHAVAHAHGFSKERITTLMRDAGLEDVTFSESEEELKFGPFERKLFVARGTKAPPMKLGLSQATAWNLMY